EAGIALSHFIKRKALEFTNVLFDEPLIDLDREAIIGCNGSRGVDRAREGARVNGDDRLGAERPRQEFGLPASRLVEGNVRTAKGQPLAVGVGFAVPHQEETRSDYSSRWPARRYAESTGGTSSSERRVRRISAVEGRPMAAATWSARAVRSGSARRRITISEQVFGPRVRRRSRMRGRRSYSRTFFSRRYSEGRVVASSIEETARRSGAGSTPSTRASYSAQRT